MEGEYGGALVEERVVLVLVLVLVADLVAAVVLLLGGVALDDGVLELAHLAVPLALEVVEVDVLLGHAVLLLAAEVVLLGQDGLRLHLVVLAQGTPLRGEWHRRYLLLEGGLVVHGVGVLARDSLQGRLLGVALHFG